MKDTSNKAETSSAYALKEIGAYAMVYYQPDINLKRLLSIFGIAESNTEVIRNIMKENQIILLYGNIFHNTGSPILPGTIIKVHKKYLSSEIKKSLGGSENAKLPPSSKKIAGPFASSIQNSAISNVREEFSLLMKDRTVRYSLFGCGVAVLAMAVAASAISILDMPPPPKKKALVIEVDKEEPKKSDAQTGKSYADASAETVANRFPEPAAQNGLPPSGIVDGQFFFSSRSSAEELKSIIDQMNAMSSSKK